MCKKGLFVLFFILLTLSSRAQLAPIGTKWLYEWWNFGDFHQYGGYDQYEIDKEVTIDSVIYSNIKGRKYLFTKLDNKVYYYFKNKKHLYFDFNVNVGDTSFVDFYDSKNYYRNNVDSLYINFPIVITKKEYIHNPFNRDSLLTFYFEPLMKPYYSMFGRVTEKILRADAKGTSGLDIMLFNQPEFESGIQFRCYIEPTGFEFKMINDCNKAFLKEVFKSPNIMVFPNPTDDIFTISLNSLFSNNYSMIIYDYKGVELLVRRMKQIETFTKSELRLSNGLYWIKINDENTSYWSKLIIE